MEKTGELGLLSLRRLQHQELQDLFQVVVAEVGDGQEVEGQVGELDHDPGLFDSSVRVLPLEVLELALDDAAVPPVPDGQVENRKLHFDDPVSILLKLDGLCDDAVGHGQLR